MKTMKMNSLIKFILVGGTTAILLSGCYTDKSKRNIEYSPNMGNSLALEPYSQTEVNNKSLGGYLAAAPIDGKVTYFKDGRSAQNAPAGTLPRGESWYSEEVYEPYPFGNTTDGYDSAGVLWKSPLNNPATNQNGFNCTQASYEQGKRVYEIYCVNCHGANGDGQGNLVTAGVYAGVPAYKDRPNITEGNMFHVLTHGKGIMGSHASQLTPKERWAVICYIQEFQKQ